MLNYVMKEFSFLQNTKHCFAFLLFTEKPDFCITRFFPFLSDNGEDPSCELMPKNFRESAASILTFSFECRAVGVLNSAEVWLRAGFQTFEWPRLS